MSSTILVKIFKDVGALAGSAIIAIACKQKHTAVKHFDYFMTSYLVL